MLDNLNASIKFFYLNRIINKILHCLVFGSFFFSVLGQTQFEKTELISKTLIRISAIWQKMTEIQHFISLISMRLESPKKTTTSPGFTSCRARHSIGISATFKMKDGRSRIK